MAGYTTLYKSENGHDLITVKVVRGPGECVLLWQPERTDTGERNTMV